MDLIGLYPTWYEPGLGSGWVVGIIATVHVLFSHTAVGAALFFAYLSNKAYREDRPELLEYIKKYGLFLLIFSYVRVLRHRGGRRLHDCLSGGPGG